MANHTTSVGMEIGLPHCPQNRTPGAIAAPQDAQAVLGVADVAGGGAASRGARTADFRLRNAHATARTRREIATQLSAGGHPAVTVKVPGIDPTSISSGSAPGARLSHARRLSRRNSQPCRAPRGTSHLTVRRVPSPLIDSLAGAFITMRNLPGATVFEPQLIAVGNVPGLTLFGASAAGS